MPISSLSANSFENDLRHATARAMQGAPCPMRLRNAITAQLSAPSKTTTKHVSVLKMNLWRYAIAASFILTLTVGYVIGAQGWHHPLESIAHADEDFNQKLIRRHEECQKNLDLLSESNLFSIDPTDLSLLSTKINTQINASTSMPFVFDLSKRGYFFSKAGLCSIPAEHAVHLIYHNGKNEKISIWIDSTAGLKNTRQCYLFLGKKYSIGHVVLNSYNVYVLASSASEMVSVLQLLEGAGTTHPIDQKRDLFYLSRG